MPIDRKSSAHGEMIDMILYSEASRGYRHMWEDNIEMNLNICCESVD
jgi:hypothetical protein